MTDKTKRLAALKNLVPFDEGSVRHIATIIGPHGAAAKALIELERRRDAGEDVAIFRYGDSIVVGPRDTDTKDTAR